MKHKKRHAQHVFFLLFYFYSVFLSIPSTKETTSTKMTAPNIDGTIAIPAICGPHEPKIAWLKVEPTSPAIKLAINPIDPPLPVMKPAIRPIIAPTIKTQIHDNIGSPICFLFSYC